MFITNVLLKKAKAKKILALVESTVSGHRLLIIRDRLGDKIEKVAFDPFIQQYAVYRETKKIKSVR